MNTASVVIVVAATTAGGFFSFARWIRIAQREHYLPGSTSRFAARWWMARPLSMLTAVFAVFGFVLSIWFPLGACITGLALIVGPFGLTVRGRSAPLVWTRRLKTVVAVAGSLIVAGAALISTAIGSVAPLALSTLAIPVLIDLSLLILRPVEKRIAQRYVNQASERLRAVRPVVVAITGSYGKTTTKEYVRHLVSGVRTVVASPASYNNTAGLSRTINEHLTIGTDVLVAEIGTYGKGEIREICRWLRPTIGVITAIGPVHLERMGSLEEIARAKAEILETVDLAILNTDFLHLRQIADKTSADKSVIECGSDKERNYVAAIPSGQSIELYISGKRVTALSKPEIFPGNLASAVAVALTLDIPVEHIIRQIPLLPSPAHRQQLVTTPAGVKVIDDTFSSNPDGAANALKLLSEASCRGRRVVVSPGMIELGDQQDHENEQFARKAADSATDILIVGRTNLDSLLRGARSGKARVRTVRHRDEAVRWVRENLTEGDVVLYENDLPDHFP
jgi:UDP-N-acetylmuramoyl-tripeptide--D-alanyl-D-alanine ligase